MTTLSSQMRLPYAIDPLLLQLDHRQFFLPGFQRPDQELAKLAGHLIHVVRLDGPLAGKEIGRPQLPHAELFQGSDEQRHRVRIPGMCTAPSLPYWGCTPTKTLIASAEAYYPIPNT
jgi:hypothetical protein